MGAKTEKQKMLKGDLYRASDPELAAERMRARRLTRLFNETAEDETEARRELLRELFAAIGSRIDVEPPFRCDYGSNIRVGDGFYANYDCVILDCAAVTIGNAVKLGPGVKIVAAFHPTDPRERASGLELAAPVTIGDNVWVGAGAIIGPGVTIGPHTTIGAGSVVTRDVPARVVAAGVPCRVMRRLAEGAPPVGDADDPDSAR